MRLETVLLIDDDDSLRRVVEFWLTEDGYKVLTACNGDEGLELFHRTDPTLVITDIKMTGMSGLEVLKHIKERKPDTLVLVISGFGSVEDAVRAMKIGAFDYLTKPFGKEEFLLTMNKALEYRGLKEENQLLRSRLSSENFPSIIARSDKMKAVLSLSRKVAASEATVLLLGESGTGKEVIARAIHQASDRSKGPLVPVNCAAIPHNLLESELFGHAKGAFTGAIRDRIGKFQQADGGTIFLDEIGELPLELQPKLLRVLQEREIEPVGGSRRRVDVRVVAATNRDLEEIVAQGEFREDLYYRLAVIPIFIPPLRKRREDIPALVKFFLQKHGGDDITIGEGAMQRLMDYNWPGNVRELENVVERMLVLSRSDVIEECDLPPRIRIKSCPRPGQAVVSLPDEGYSLEDIEKEVITEALLRHDWNRARAASFLRIPRHILVYRMEKFNIQK